MGGAPGEVSAAPQGGTRGSSTADLSSVGVANTAQGGNDTTGAGSGSGHNNLQPYVALTYIIKAG